MTKKYTLTVTEGQAQIMQQALELYARIQAGQLRDLQWLAPGPKGSDWAAIQDATDVLHAAMFPGEPSGYADFSRGTAAEAYDLMTVIRHRLSWDRHPEGGITVNFDRPICRGKEPMAHIESAEQHGAEVRRQKESRKRREDEWCEAVQGLREAIAEAYPDEPSDGYYGELLATATRLIRAHGWADRISGGCDD